MPRYAMVIDLRKCVGCMSCSVACKVENSVPPSVFRSWVKVMEKGIYPKVKQYFLPVLCNNCERAICVRVCPTKASYQRDDGIVMVDPHKCIGCKYCIAACPYQMRHLNPLKRHAQKCYFCNHRVDSGLKPACVETCPANARIFGDIKDPESEISKILLSMPTNLLKPEMGTKPMVFYIGLDKDIANPLKGLDIERFVTHDLHVLGE